ERRIRRRIDGVVQEVRGGTVAERALGGRALIQEVALDLEAELQRVFALGPRPVVEHTDGFGWIVGSGRAGEGTEARDAESVRQRRKSSAVAEVLVDSELHFVDQRRREDV